MRSLSFQMFLLEGWRAEEGVVLAKLRHFPIGPCTRAHGARQASVGLCWCAKTYIFLGLNSGPLWSNGLTINMCEDSIVFKILYMTFASTGGMVWTPYNTTCFSIHFINNIYSIKKVNKTYLAIALLGPHHSLYHNIYTFMIVCLIPTNKWQPNNNIA